MLLGRAGIEVHVFERQQRIGGRTATFEAEGFRFDVGATFFMYPQILEELFEAAGKNLRESVELVKLDPQYHLIFEEGGEILATPDVTRMEAELAKLSPEDAGQLRSFLADNRRKLEAFRPILQRPFGSAWHLMNSTLGRSLALLRPWTSVDGDLRRYFRDPRVRLAFSFQSKYLGMSPFKCPSLFTILSFLEYEYGVFHPVGGCGALTRAMATAAEELGVQIHLGEEVRELEFTGRKVRALRTQEGRYETDALVINADFARAMRRLVPDDLRNRWKNARMARKKFSCSTFMLYLGLEGRYDDLAHHTIFMSRDYRRNLREIEDGHVLSEEPSFYVQNASVTDSSLAPSGMSTLYVLAPVTHQHANVDWGREKERYRRLILQRLEKVGIRGIEERIRYEKITTPDDWSGEMEIHLGATFNLAHNFGQMLHLRPRNRFEDLEGVYLVGGGTHPGSGLPVIFESARISAGLLLCDLEVEPGWAPSQKVQRETTVAPLPLEVI